jgi:hypothetical protein
MEYTVSLTTAPGAATEAALDALHQHLIDGLGHDKVLYPVLTMDAATGALTLTCQVNVRMGDACTAVQQARGALGDARLDVGTPLGGGVVQAHAEPYAA